MPGPSLPTPESALRGLAALGARLRRGQSLSVRSAGQLLDDAAVEDHLAGIGRAAGNARRLDEAAEAVTQRIVSLSPLTAGMALDYIDRLARPIPALSPEVGVEIVTHAYAAHLALEADPSAYGSADVPILATFPRLKRGRPPQDILTRAVKASRRGFPEIRAVSESVWDGYVVLLTSRVHQATTPGNDLVALDVVDGLARFGWVLRQVDIHYQLSPELLG